MNTDLNGRLIAALDELRRDGAYKTPHYLDGPMGAHVPMDGNREVLVLSSNDYLGLANHPQVVRGAREALDKYGASTTSVRFICGTLTIHRELEQALAAFLGTEAALTYSSCWAANTGLIAAITKPGDVVLSDELNHASIIDGCRLAGADVIRCVYRHADMGQLERLLIQHRNAPARFIITDGVFSMEGDLAPLPDIVSLAREHAAAVIVDDSHGMGVLGSGGRGSPEHFGVQDGIDIFTGTLGKALGAGTGGFVCGSSALIDLLAQTSRPHLYSNAVPASVAGASIAALNYLEQHPESVAELHAKAEYFRSRLKEINLNPIDGHAAIVPVVIGDTARAIRLANRLLERGLFVSGFGYPVVPEGMARLRFQISRSHSITDLDRAVKIISDVYESLPA